MRRVKRQRLTLPLYLIPIMIGLCGILFSRQFPNPVVRTVLVLACMGAPLFTMGTAVVRLNIARGQQILLFLGACMLTTGAVVTLGDLTSSFELFGPLPGASDVPGPIWEISRWLGMLGLLLGLFVLLYNAVWREQKVGELLDRFSSLAQHMGEGFVLSDADGTITQVNKSLLDMTGFRESDILGRDADELVETLELEPMQRATAPGRPAGVAEYTLQWDRNGMHRRFWITSSPLFAPGGELAGTLSTFRDITELHDLSERLEDYTRGLQKLVEDRTEQLRKSEDRLRGLLVHMNEGFLTVDTSFIVRFANDRIRSLLGIGGGDMRGRSVFDFTDPASHAVLLDLFRLAEHPEEADTGRVRREMDLLHEEGTLVPVMVAVSLVPASAGEDTRFSLVTTDISEMKVMQAQIEERAAELEAANEELRLVGRAKDTFLTNVTHELRTPLSTIRGYVEMFEAGSLGHLDEHQDHALKVMSRNLERLGTLIEEMLDFSRMEIRGIELVRSLSRLDRVARESVASATPQLREKGMRAEVEADDALPAVWADRKRLAQMLAILLSNAAKFSPQGSTIHIRVTRHGEDGASIAVIDEGIGIDPAYHQRVFDKFFQVDSSLARKYEGAGIGLPIAMSIARAHGGTIELDSTPGQGSTFTAILPECVFELPLDGGEPTSAHPLSVMLVDDTQESREALAEVLRAAGMSVCEMASSFEALRRAAADPPDILVLPDTLQERPCASILVSLRENQATSDIPALVLAGERMRPADADRLEGHAAALLRRPFGARALVRAIGKAHSPSGAVDGPEPGDKHNGIDVSPRVLVVDADGDFGEWLVTGLGLRGITCLRASGPEHVLELAGAAPPAAVFVDIDSWSDTAGALRRLRDPGSGTTRCTLVAVTGLTHPGEPPPGFDSVLRKPFPLARAVELAGGNGVHPDRT
jgi:PAS domain S-box-containing protein